MKYVELRKQFHRLPELSGQEKNTSKTIVSFLEYCKPDKIVTGIGGYGIAAVFSGSRKGQRVMVRCELDALPIPETLDIPHRSEAMGVSHKCGHDGHMAIVAGLAERLHTHRPESGSVILLFQPAEETGEGADRVLSDSKFDQIQPDYVLALHNLPGYPLGQIIVREGVFASASSGLRIHLKGKTSHAAEPETGNSPALAVAQLIQVLSSIPQYYTSLHEPAQATVIHAKVGDVAFGTSPGEGSSASFELRHGYWQDFASGGGTCCMGAIRGNVDMDGGDVIDISDLVFLVDYMFTGGPPPTCDEEANNDGSCCASGSSESLSDIDISDLVYLVDYMFNGGPAPPPCP